MHTATKFALIAVFSLIACKNDDKPSAGAASSAAGTTTATPTTTAQGTAATTATAAQGAVTVTPEMTSFMAMLDGKDGSARSALKKYGEPGVQGDDLGMYMLKDPKVTKSAKVGDQQCFTMESAAGAMKHTTQVCWDAKSKIAKISDTSE
jgi:hypothetical protein